MSNAAQRLLSTFDDRRVNVDAVGRGTAVVERLRIHAIGDGAGLGELFHRSGSSNEEEGPAGEAGPPLHVHPQAYETAS